MKKRTIAAIVCVAGIVGALAATAVAQSQRFPDVPPDHYASEAVEWAADVGDTTAYTDGTFKPEQPLSKRHAVVFMERYYDEIFGADQSDDFTRGDMMVLLKAINDGTLRGETPQDAAPETAGAAQSQRFPDVPADHYAFEAVEWAAEAGVTTGYTDGTFKPQRPLSKRHAVVFMERYYDEILGADQSDDFTRGDMMVLLKAINDGTLRDTAQAITMLSEGPPSVRLVFRNQQIAVVDENGEILTLTDDQSSSTVHLSQTGFRSARRAAWSPDRTRFLYSSGPDYDQQDLFVMKPDGTDKVQLSNEGYEGIADVSWSPDGLKVAYIGVHRVPTDDDPYHRIRELTVVDATGSNLRRIRLTDADHSIGFGDVSVDALSGIGGNFNYASIGSWTSDQNTIVLSAYPPIGATLSYLVNIDSKQITYIGIQSPSWSPSGTRFTYDLSYFDDETLFASNGCRLANADGTNNITLTTSGGSCHGWSPDGARILYSSGASNDPDQSDDPNHLYSAEADGTNPTILATNSSSGEWSPDGAHIMYRQDDGALFVAEANGTNQTILTTKSVRYSFGGWSPDGAHIVYRQDDGAFFVAEADGTNPRRLASGAHSPRWSPDGSHLHYFADVNSDTSDPRYIIETAAGAPVSDIDLTDAKAHFRSGPPFAGWADWGPSGIYGVLDWRWGAGG